MWPDVPDDVAHRFVDGGGRVGGVGLRLWFGVALHRCGDCLVGIGNGNAAAEASGSDLARCRAAHRDEVGVHLSRESRGGFSPVLVGPGRVNDDGLTQREQPLRPSQQLGVRALRPDGRVEPPLVGGRGMALGI